MLPFNQDRLIHDCLLRFCSKSSSLRFYTGCFLLLLTSGNSDGFLWGKRNPLSLWGITPTPALDVVGSMGWVCQVTLEWSVISLPTVMVLEMFLWPGQIQWDIRHSNVIFFLMSLLRTLFSPCVTLDLAWQDVDLELRPVILPELRPVILPQPQPCLRKKLT